MWTYNQTPCLEHAGVRGMRWGHRNARPAPYSHNRPRYNPEPYGRPRPRPRPSTISGERVVSTVLAGAGGAMLARSATRMLLTRNKNASLVASIVGGTLGMTAVTAINAHNDRTNQDQDYEYDYY